MANSLADFIDVGIHLFADIGHFIDETDLGGQHAVGCILHHFRAFYSHRDERLLRAKEWLVQLVDDVGRFFFVHADDDTVGLGEVVNRGSFLQKLGVGC